MGRLCLVCILVGCGGDVGVVDGGASSMDAASAPDGGTPRDAGPPFDAGPPLRVLFVGNSYTYFNDMPGVVAAIGATTGAYVEVDTVTQGGATLRDHWESTGARGRVESEAFDAVVIQGQSLEAANMGGDFDVHAERFADALAEAGSEGVWFATWARRDVEGEPRALMEAIEASYERAAAHHGGTVARVGAAWEIALLADPDLELFEADRSHPTAAGSLLTACVIFEALTGRAPVLPDPAPLGVPPDVARALCAIADDGVRCDPEQSLCDGACVDWDSSSCGGCDVACSPGDPCQLGVCGCPAPRVGCHEVCTWIQSDPRNCGACDRACPLAAVCDEGECACPPGRVRLDAFVPTDLDPGCDAWGGEPEACARAAHRGCAAVGDALACFTSGFGPPMGHAPSPPELRCVNGDVRETTYTQLSTHVPECDGVTERIGAGCTTAIHRHCVAAGAVSGFGPVESDGDSVTVTCLSDATVVATTMDELSGWASRCVPDAQSCSVAAWNYCASIGHDSGYGPVEVDGGDVEVVCVGPTS